MTPNTLTDYNCRVRPTSFARLYRYIISTPVMLDAELVAADVIIHRPAFRLLLCRSPRLNLGTPPMGIHNFHNIIY